MLLVEVSVVFGGVTLLRWLDLIIYMYIVEKKINWKSIIFVVFFLVTNGGCSQCMDRVIGGISDFVGLCVCPRYTRKITSYQHQTWCTYTLWKDFGMHWPWGQIIKGQGHRVMKCAAGIGMHIDITV